MDRKPIASADSGLLTPSQPKPRLAPAPCPLDGGSDETSAPQGFVKLGEDLRTLGVDARGVDLILTLIEQFSGREAGGMPSAFRALAQLAGRIADLEDAVHTVTQDQQSLRAQFLGRLSGEHGDHSLTGSPHPRPMGAPPRLSAGARPLPGPHRIPADEAGTRGHSPYLDAEQAAAYLGITMSSLYGVVERGRLTPLRGPRRRYRFTTTMLDEYLARRDGK